MATKTKRTVRDGIEEWLHPTGPIKERPRFRARIKIDGKVRTGKVHRTRSAAIADRNNLRTTVEELPTVIMTLADCWEAVQQRSNKPGPVTMSSYAERLDVIRRYIPLSTPVSKITGEVIERYVHRRTSTDEPLPHVRPSTARADVRVLSVCLTEAVFKRALAQNPVKLARIPKPREDVTKRDWMTQQQIIEILDRIRSWPASSRLDPNRDADVMELFALTGLRLKAVSLLTVGKIDLSKGTIVIPHDKKRGRVFHMGDGNDLDVLVRGLLGDRHPRAHRDEPLLPLGRDGMESMFRRWRKRLDEPRLHAHAFRHSYLTWVAKTTGSVYQVMLAGGITVESTARVYVHLAGVEEDDRVKSLSFRRKPKSAALQPSRPSRRRAARGGSS